MAELDEGRGGEDSIAMLAFEDETESAALNLFNLSDSPVTIRVESDTDWVTDAGESRRASEVLTLHEAVAVPTSVGAFSSDALPLLNQGQTMVVPAWGARQLWLNVMTGDLKPGTWRSALQLRTLELQPRLMTVDLEVTVSARPMIAQADALKLCHWGYVQNSVLRDQPEAALADQIAHGTNVFVGLFYPKAEYDANGDLVGEIDYAAHDAYVREHTPHGMILFFNYMHALRGPKDASEEAQRKAHITWLRAWVAHLAELGVEYEDFALYPIDEPGLRDGVLIEAFIKYGKLAREADPKLLVYQDPVRDASLEDLKRMAPYTDIWCPNRGSYFHGEPGTTKLAFLKSTGNPVWTYECQNNAKHQTPLGYYRGQAWLAWQQGLTGIGFWNYCIGKDAWAEKSEYPMIYRGAGVVTSKRWEAVRDGIEDYALLLALRRASESVDASLREEAAQILGERADGIAAFCGMDEEGLPAETTPDVGGLPAERRKADAQWQLVQDTRAAIAFLFARMGQVSG
jgi:hypothetical protein